MVKVLDKISDFLEVFENKGLVVTIGNFDGVHLGHQFLISESLKKAEELNCELIVITFDPHPVEIFAPDVNKFLILPFDEKIDRIEKAGCSNVVVFKFDRDFSMLSASDFLEKHILENGKNTNLKSLVLGYDFSFGSDRKGDFSFAKKYLGKKGVEVVQAGKFGEQEISSSMIRSLVNEGKVELVNELLGANFYCKGLVIKGEGRGKQIGIPTANINIDSRYIHPSPGVYITQIQIGETVYNSVTNIGFRPTFGKNSLNIETHIFDFNKEIYGEYIKVYFIKKIRNEIAFSSIDLLIEQIKADVLTSNRYFLETKTD